MSEVTNLNTFSAEGHRRLLVEVLDCIGTVTPGVLAGTSPHGARIGIPGERLRRLVALVEEQVPGALAQAQEAEQSRQRARQAVRRSLS